MRVKWLRRALANYVVELEHISNDDLNAAARVATNIIESVERLKRYPAIGRPGRVLGTRELVVSGTPYIVPYRVRGDVIEILRVFHGARKWPNRF